MHPIEIVKPVTDGFQQNLSELLRGLDGPMTPERFEAFLSGLKEVVHRAGRDALVRTVEAKDCQEATFGQSGRRFRYKLDSPKEWLTSFGKVTVTRRYYQPDAGGRGQAPLDACCGMRGKFMTPAVEEAAALGASMLVPSEVSRLLAKVLPEGPSATAVGRVVAEVGRFAEQHPERIEAALEARAPLSREGQALVVSYDGVTVPLREGAPRRGRPAERPGVRPDGPGRTAWREAGVGTVSVYGPGPEDAPERPRRLDTRYVARMPQPHMERLLEQLGGQVRRLLSERTYRHRVLLCDGKPSLWKAAGRNEAFAGFTYILDFYHAAENLSRAAEAIFGKGSVRGRRWYEKWRAALKESPQGASGVLRSMRYYRGSPGMSKQRRETLDRMIGYVARNRDKMHYADYRRLGLPIGSGPVEAACKTVVGHRLKRSGMRWTRPGGQQVLNLRTHMLSNRWDVFWKEYISSAA